MNIEIFNKNTRRLKFHEKSFLISSFDLRPMTLLVLLPTPARTRIIASNILVSCFISRRKLVYLRRRLFLNNKLKKITEYPLLEIRLHPGKKLGAFASIFSQRITL